jgi:hypothetical protein
LNIKILYISVIFILFLYSVIKSIKFLHLLFIIKSILVLRFLSHYFLSFQFFKRLELFVSSLISYAWIFYIFVCDEWTKQSSNFYFVLFLNLMPGIECSSLLFGGNFLKLWNYAGVKWVGSRWRRECALVNLFLRIYGDFWREISSFESSLLPDYSRLITSYSYFLWGL